MIEPQCTYGSFLYDFDRWFQFAVAKTEFRLLEVKTERMIARTTFVALQRFMNGQHYKLEIRCLKCGNRTRVEASR